jgi:hypothetical protein
LRIPTFLRTIRGVEIIAINANEIGVHTPRSSLSNGHVFPDVEAGWTLFTLVHAGFWISCDYADNQMRKDETTMKGLTSRMCTVFRSACFLLVTYCGGQSSGREWVLLHGETFDDVQEIHDQASFGEKNWLTARLRGNGTITLKDGLAHFETPGFRDSALLQMTNSLPAEYKIRVRLGQIRYGIKKYTDADFNSKGFKYNRRYLENGFYWLTLTDRLVEETSGEDWWHRYRKIVVDSDDHLGEHFPVYMVYMNPALNRSTGDWIGGQPNLLRCWSKGKWFTGKEDWKPAFRYKEKDWYVVELEKDSENLVMRVLSDDGTVIQETAPVSLDRIYGMGKNASEFEYAYVGEPHIDSYKGDAFVDDIKLFVPSDEGTPSEK